MIDNCTLNNNKAQVSIVEIEGRKLIVYLKTVARFEVIIEDIATGERVFSNGAFTTPEQAFNDAFSRLSHND